MLQSERVTELLVVIVIGLVAIVAGTLIAPRLGLASPLVLVAIGVGASFLPQLAQVDIKPEWILEGVLPPLLYSAAVSMPAMNFRREFGAISGLSILLVVGSALVMGVFFAMAIPGLGFTWGVALGAIVSPTDAVATSIIKKTAVSKRVVAILDGESLLNDATALVILRTAIAATAAAFSFWHALGSFGYSVAIALVIGVLAGMLNLSVRKQVKDPTVNTVISFTVPFLASVPTTLLGASGLVAAVVAGLITGIRAPHDLSPQTRLSDSQNWRTVELVLEGAVFLTMGIQIKSIVSHVQTDHGGIGRAVWVAAGALVLTILVRALYVTPLLGYLSWRARHGAAMRDMLQDVHERMDTPEGKQESFAKFNRARRAPSERTLDRFATRVRQGLANIDYLLREPLGWREGTAVVWAGMRGAVTVAAAQSLPEDAPLRSVLVLVAFSVATMSLLIQGGTIGPLLAVIAPKVDPELVRERTRAEIDRLFELLRMSSEGIIEPSHPDTRSLEDFQIARQYRLAVLAAQRAALLDARENGTFDADVLENALANLDATEISIEMRGNLAA